MHGIIRVKGGYFLGAMDMKEDKAKVRRQLGDAWNEVHGAFAVQVDKVKKYSDMTTYISQHILKDYSSAGMPRNCFLVSGGWRRDGVKNIVQEVKDWWISGTGYTWLNNAGWRVVNRSGAGLF